MAWVWNDLIVAWVAWSTVHFAHVTINNRYFLGVLITWSCFVTPNWKIIEPYTNHYKHQVNMENL